MFKRMANIGIVISKPDLESDLNHLNSLPYTVTTELPSEWGTKQVMDWLISEMPSKLNYGDSFEFGTGLWGHVKPLGYEFLGYENRNSKVQIVISVRSVETDLDNLINIEKTM